MRITVSTLARATGLAACSAIALFAAPAAVNASVPVQIRVDTDQGNELANVVQYAPSEAKVRTYAGDDCFDPTPPIKQSSGQTYKQTAPNMLSAIDEASDAKPSLQPFRISDADYTSFGSLSICTIGASTPPGFWFLKTNHVGNSTGADQTFVHDGDQLLFYRTPGDFSADEELSLDGPVRTTPGVPITVQVRSFQGDGTVVPGTGATVTGGSSPAAVDGSGNAVATFASEGTFSLIAMKDYNDIPSAALKVCVAKDLNSCPPVAGMEILGSHENDTITGSAGPDHIKPRAGDDGVRGLAGDDKIDTRGGGKDRVNCGGGDDTVKAGKGDKLGKNCEHKTRKGKKHTRKKGGKRK